MVFPPVRIMLMQQETEGLHLIQAEVKLNAASLTHPVKTLKDSDLFPSSLKHGVFVSYILPTPSQ